MQYCSRCVYPGNHPLNIVFRDNALCSGCLVHEEKDQLDGFAVEKLYNHRMIHIGNITAEVEP